MLTSDTFTFRSNDNTQLFVNVWKGQAQNSKILLIIHGFGEHSGRYEHVPGFLAENFERFYAIDLRGHGRSGGLRGHAPCFEQFNEDVKKFLYEVRQREKDKKLILLAHSFGGLVALNYLLHENKNPFESVIISAPLLGVALKIPAYKKVLAKVLYFTLPKLQLANEVNPSYLSHDPKIVEAYVNDRLVHHKMTPTLYKEMCAVMDWINAQTGPLSVPSLFLIPDQDHIVSSDTSKKFYRNLKSRDKQLREYPEMYHEVLNEVDKEKVFSDIKAWLQR